MNSFSIEKIDKNFARAGEERRGVEDSAFLPFPESPFIIVFPNFQYHFTNQLAEKSAKIF